MQTYSKYEQNSEIQQRTKIKTSNMNSLIAKCDANKTV